MQGGHGYRPPVRVPVAGPPERERIFERIRAEYEACHEVLLQITGQEELWDCDPALQRSLRLRNPYVDPLSYIQVSLLRRNRAPQGQSGPEVEAAVAALREPLHLTINGIATAMRSTGRTDPGLPPGKASRMRNYVQGVADDL